MIDQARFAQANNFKPGMGERERTGSFMWPLSGTSSRNFSDSGSETSKKT
jgi:hypothetical protein